jgi:hypothetical protein
LNAEPRASGTRHVGIAQLRCAEKDDFDVICQGVDSEYASGGTLGRNLLVVARHCSGECHYLALGGDADMRGVD